LFSSLDALRAACLDLPPGDLKAAAVAAERQRQLTKPPGSLGRLEDVVVWLARWQGRSMPRLDPVDILVFAGHHRVAGQGVSASPAEVTAQMVANLSAGGAAINQLARTVGANLHVVPLALEQPTADFTRTLAMTEDAFLAAVGIGYEAVSSDADLVCLGEMGIGNTTAAAAIPAALVGGGRDGGGGAGGAGRGAGGERGGGPKTRAGPAGGPPRRGALRRAPLPSAAAWGGRGPPAIRGAALGARHRRIPVLLDGFVCVSA